MTDQREILKAHHARCEERVCCLKSYVKELTDMAEKHGIGSEQFEEELSKARSDIEYYEGQVAQAAEQLGDANARRTFQVYRDEGDEWRWRLVAGNGQIIAVSGEGYRERRDCLHGVELVKDSKEAAVEGGD